LEKEDDSEEPAIEGDYGSEVGVQDYYSEDDQEELEEGLEDEMEDESQEEE
jgi:hypothetical protein